MTVETIGNYFPNGQFVSLPLYQAGHRYLPVATDQWLEVPEEDLTEREQALLDLLLSQEASLSSHPWVRFLQGQLDKRPQPIQKLQFLHIRIWKEAADSEAGESWLQVLAAALPLPHVSMRVSERYALVVFDQSQVVAIQEVLEEALLALAVDFGVRLTFFMGQMWSDLSDSDLQRVYQEEKSLFKAWQVAHSQSRLLTFTTLFLWAQGVGLRLPHMTKVLREMLYHQEQLSDIILALWQEGGVVTKAAQALYLHRNTLNYRLDKWQELSGLQLRELTDLAVCYGLVMERAF